jgi:hypothetical protein
VKVQRFWVQGFRGSGFRGSGFRVQRFRSSDFHITLNSERGTLNLEMFKGSEVK